MVRGIEKNQASRKPGAIGSQAPLQDLFPTVLGTEAPSASTQLIELLVRRTLGFGAQESTLMP